MYANSVANASRMQRKPIQDHPDRKNFTMGPARKSTSYHADSIVKSGRSHRETMPIWMILDGFPVHPGCICDAVCVHFRLLSSHIFFGLVNIFFGIGTIFFGQANISFGLASIFFGLGSSFLWHFFTPQECGPGRAKCEPTPRARTGPHS